MGIRIVVQDTGGNRHNQVCVFRNGERIGSCFRCIVDRVHIDCHGSGSRATISVGDRVSKRIRAIEVFVRRVSHVRISKRNHTVEALRYTLDCQRIVGVNSGIIVQHRDCNSNIFIRAG